MPQKIMASTVELFSYTAEAALVGTQVRAAIGYKGQCQATQ